MQLTQCDTDDRLVRGTAATSAGRQILSLKIVQSNVATQVLSPCHNRSKEAGGPVWGALP